MPLPSPVEEIDLAHFSPADQRRLNELAARVWPTGRSHLPQYASAPAPQHDWPTTQRPRTFIIRDPAGLIIANASARPRLVRTAHADLPILALAMVLTDPQHRGRGLGRAVVQAAFSLVDRGDFPAAFFQTDVPDFYRKLGARTVDNPIINSLALQPGSYPLWSSYAMVYPSTFQFPTGPIDLRGPGW